jgi:ABC-2 type transport system permease protein
VRWGAVAAVTRKDLATVLRNKGVRIPLIAAPFVILVLLPVLLVSGGDLLMSAAPSALTDPTGGGATLADRFTPEAAEAATGVAGEGRWAAFILLVFLAPLYLLIPLMVATVIAADSFAGERDRGTLEALLHTPTTDAELLTAKFLAAWIPAMVVSLGGFLVYSVIANLVAWPSIGRVFFPNLTWVVLALFVTPAIAALGLGIMVIVSSRVQSLQAAHQFGSLVVLPIILLLIAQISGAILVDTAVVAAMGVVVWLAAWLVLRIAAQRFTREQLASRL